jgi:hypothetical protein
LTGRHHIRVVLADHSFSKSPVHEVENAYSPATPALTRSSNELSWQPVENAEYYEVWKNGRSIRKTNRTSTAIQTEGYAEYQVVAVDQKGFRSFSSEPYVVKADGVEQVYEIENYAAKSGLGYKGFTGEGYVEISKGIHDTVTIPVYVKEPGLYAMDLRYSNGNGPVNTENKCAVRTLKVNGKMAGTLVMPQRGKGEWSNWGYSNPVTLRLDKGMNQVSILFEDYNENMNGDINQAMLDQMRVIRLSGK